MLVILAIALDAIGGFSVAAVIPQKELSLSAGVIQTFESLLLHFNPHLGWLVKLIALMIAFGVMGEVSSWVVGPSRGMFAAAQRGLLPTFFAKAQQTWRPCSANHDSRNHRFNMGCCSNVWRRWKQLIFLGSYFADSSDLFDWLFAVFLGLFVLLF